MHPFRIQLTLMLKRIRAVFNLPLIAAAIVWRRTVLRNVTVIAISGSVGKTTAKECLVAILQRRDPIIAVPAGSNGRFGLPRLLLRARPRHRIIVAEVGIVKPGRMWRAAFLVKPDITVITRVNWQHSRNFHSLDQIAEQKAKLLDPLGSHGLAILNADDARVAAMARGRSCRVTTFGLNNKADVQGEAAASQWPDCLSLKVSDGTQTHEIQTRFIGTHWASSVLAAVAAARAVGASWEDCAAGILTLEAFPARLSSLKLPNGADLLRDEYNGSFATLEQGLEIINQARCARKIIAIGNVRDAPQFGDQYPEEVARRCTAVCDLMLFWGEFTERSRQAALEAGAAPESVFVFKTQIELADFIRVNTRSGDLILLKGYWSDHLSRIAFTQFGTVSCSVELCLRHYLCDRCSRLNFQPNPNIAAHLLQPLLAGQARLKKRDNPD